MPLAAHHLHQRKRFYKNKERFPHPNKWKRILDTMVYIVGILSPIFTIAQILKIFLNKTATGVSLISWIAYTFTAFILFLYGLSHKEKPLIIMYSLAIIVNLFVVIGIAIYG